MAGSRAGLSTLFWVAAMLCAALAAPAAAETTVDAGKGGVTFKSGDNSLTIYGGVQFRYTMNDRESFDADTVGDGDGVADGPSHQFRVERMRISFTGGVFKPWLKYGFQFELGDTPGERDNKIKDAFVSIEKLPLAMVKVGQYKTPFGLQQLTSSFKSQFMFRAITAFKFTAFRDQGIMLTGITKERHLGYSAGAFNGGGESRNQEDSALLYVGRVWWDPLAEYKLMEGASDFPEKAQLHFGVAGRTGEAANGTTVDPNTGVVFESPDNQTSFAFESAWRWKRFFATAEYFWMTDERQNPVQDSDVISDGWHAQVSMMVSKRFEVGLRGAMIDPDADSSEDYVKEGRLGITFYDRGHNFKILAEGGGIVYGAQFAGLPSIARRGFAGYGSRLSTGEQITDAQYTLLVQLFFPE